MRQEVRWGFGLLVVLATASVFAAQSGETASQSAETSARALIERVEAHHRSLPHFEARFEQTFSPRIFGRDRVESGRLTVKRPGAMRWDYETPEPKVFVSDGANTWFYVPADKQVVVGSFGGSGSGEAGMVNPLDFLTGEATILDHFDALTDEDESDGLRTISLTPHAGGEVESVQLTVEAATGRIRAIESEDPEGNRTRFTFSDIRTGAAPADSLFSFIIPPGTEVVTASDLRE